MDTKPYWILVSEAVRPYKHITQDAAIAEAVRMCRLHGGVFHVMEAQIRISRNDVAVTRLATGDDIPF